MSQFRTAIILWAAFSASALALSAQQTPTHHIAVPIGRPLFHPRSARVATRKFTGGLSATFEPSFPMRVVVKSARGRKTISLPRTFVQFKDARLYRSDLLVATGMANGDVSDVVVVNTESGSIVDSFLCYAPSIAPNGQYVAYVKFYPAHGITGVEDLYMIYDLKKSPRQNRPQGSGGSRSTVGEIMYPTGMKNQSGDNVNVNPLASHRIASDKFFWNSMSTEVVFADRYHGRYSVVIANISKGEVRARSVSIPKRWLCLNDLPCYVHLSDVKFMISATPGFTVTFRGVNGTPMRERSFRIIQNRLGRLVLARAE